MFQKSSQTSHVGGGVRIARWDEFVGPACPPLAIFAPDPASLWEQLPHGQGEERTVPIDDGLIVLVEQAVVDHSLRSGVSWIGLASGERVPEAGFTTGGWQVPRLPREGRG